MMNSFHRPVYEWKVRQWAVTDSTRVAGGTCVSIDRDRETVCLKPLVQQLQTGVSRAFAGKPGVFARGNSRLRE